MPRNRARGRNSPLTPEPMPGRQHIDVQTGQASLWSWSDLLHLQRIQFFDSFEHVLVRVQTSFSDRYLEELSDIIQTTEIEIQTDAFKDRPPSPLFIPAKSGKDAETQIEEGEVSKSFYI